MDKEPRLVAGDYVIKIVLLLSTQHFEKRTGKSDTILLLSGIKSVLHPSKIEFLECQPSRKMRKHVALAILKCRASSLQDKNGHSSNMEEITSAKSLLRGLPDLGSSESSVLPSRKRAYHL
jgi:hypothetical protein